MYREDGEVAIRDIISLVVIVALITIIVLMYIYGIKRTVKRENIEVVTETVFIDRNNDNPLTQSESREELVEKLIELNEERFNIRSNESLKEFKEKYRSYFYNEETLLNYITMTYIEDSYIMYDANLQIANTDVYLDEYFNNNINIATILTELTENNIGFNLWYVLYLSKDNQILRVETIIK